ncbi:MAG: GNAT family N-acetyltransferase [Gemmataceae bacterium]
MEYRAFRNTDPPAFIALWNQCFLGRGAYTIPSAAYVERSIFSKSYFDRKGLILAVENGQLVGFVHAGFGPNAAANGIDTKQGVVCAIAVRPTHRRRGIGAALLDHAQSYLTTKGAEVIRAGGTPPWTPFYFGLYGGSDLPGFLESDSQAGPFFLKHGYQPAVNRHIYQRSLTQPIMVADPRMMDLRKRYDIAVQPRSGLDTWWQENVVGLVEPVEFRLIDKATKAPAARAVLWEMDGFSLRWRTPSAGLLSLLVAENVRRKGVAKFFLGHLLRHLQEQCFGLCECQIDASDVAAAGLISSIGFTKVDAGTGYVRSSDVESASVIDLSTAAQAG